MHAPASQVECIIWMPHACFVATFTVMTVYVCLHETRLIAVVLANTAVTLYTLLWYYFTLHYFTIRIYIFHSSHD